MNINGPIDHLYRIHAIPKDPADDEAGDPNKRKKGRFRGREWTEEEGELPLPFSTIEKAQQEPTAPPQEMFHLEAARKELEKLTTLEEKVAQLLFWKTEATYDSIVQQEAEDAILRWQVGGIHFNQGSYKREAYLIEHYQQLSKTPLLVSNGFLHALSLYFEEDNPLPKQRENNIQMAIDLGKTIMGQNKGLKVHIQCVSGNKESTPFFTEEEVRAFAKGIKDAHGILGKEQIMQERVLIPSGDAYMYEVGGTKTLHFCDLSDENNLEERVGDLLASRYDAFIVSTPLKEIIELFVSAIQKGKISESSLDKKILKILLMKKR